VGPVSSLEALDKISAEYKDEGVCSQQTKIGGQEVVNYFKLLFLRSATTVTSADNPTEIRSLYIPSTFTLHHQRNGCRSAKAVSRNVSASCVSPVILSNHRTPPPSPNEAKKDFDLQRIKFLQPYTYISILH